MNRILGVLVPLALIVAGIRSLLAVGQEIVVLDLQDLQLAITLDQDQRIERGLAHGERLLHKPEGREYWVYSSLEEHSESEAQVFVVCPDHFAALSVGSHLRVLLRPRVVWILDKLPEDWRAKAAAIRSPVYLVDFGSGDRARMEAHCDLVDQDQGLSIWKYRVGGH